MQDSKRDSDIKNISFLLWSYFWRSSRFTQNWATCIHPTNNLSMPTSLSPLKTTSLFNMSMSLFQLCIHIHLLNTTFLPSIHWWTLRIFHICLQRIMPTWTWVCNISISLLFITISLLLLNSPKMGLLGGVVISFLVFWFTSLLFSIEASPFCLFTNCIQGFQFLHILASTFFFLIIFSLKDVRSYHIVVLICVLWRLLMLSIFSYTCLPFLFFFRDIAIVVFAHI